MLGKRKETSLEIRKLIIKYKNENRSLSEIAELVGKSRSTVQYIIKNYFERDSFDNKLRTGRPRKFNDRQSRIIVNKIRENPRLSAPKIAAEVESEMGITTNPQTIRRIIYKAGYHGRTARKKPLISPVNREKRLQFVKKYENAPNSEDNFWDRVLFTDESKFNIYGSDGRGKVWRKPNKEMDIQNLTPTVKHGGGSVMVWGCMSSAGVGKLVFIEGTMDRFMYLDILKHNLVESAAKLKLPPNWIFQQDNDPKHTSLLVKTWILYNVPKQLNSPPQSPDLNPIEHLWEELDRRIRKRNITSKESLKTALEEEWYRIETNITKKLVDSMPRRLAAVKENKGGPTKY